MLYAFDEIRLFKTQLDKLSVAKTIGQAVKFYHPPICFLAQIFSKGDSFNIQPLLRQLDSSLFSFL